MISDVLSEAVDSMSEYLKPSEFGSYSGPELRARLIDLLALMEGMRIELDASPSMSRDEVESAKRRLVENLRRRLS